jgi:hypothetical protein
MIFLQRIKKYYEKICGLRLLLPLNKLIMSAAAAGVS